MKRILTIALAALFPLGGALADAVKLQTERSEKYGTYLTDSNGRALYMFEADRQGKGDARAESNCYDACAKAWPPLTTGDEPQAASAIDPSLIDAIERKDGSRQVTYNGWPLYYFVKDKGKERATGQDVKGFGGEWYLLTAKGEKVGHASSGATR